VSANGSGFEEFTDATYRATVIKEIVNKMVFMITLSFLNQSLWCDPHLNRLSETIPMSGHTIGFDWEIRKLLFWELSILDLICCPGIQSSLSLRPAVKNDLLSYTTIVLAPVCIYCITYFYITTDCLIWHATIIWYT